VVTADADGVVSHAGTALLSEMADRVGLTAAYSEALHGLRQRPSGHDPGRVLVDVAVAIADGAETISDVQALGDQPGLHGPVASTSTIWRVLDGIDDPLLDQLRAARATARERARAARGEPTGVELPPARAAGRGLDYAVFDVDSTLVTAHSEKEGAAGNFKGGYGFHPIAVWLDNTNEALAAILRPGNAGANTAADHIAVLDLAVAQLSDTHRSKPILERNGQASAGTSSGPLLPTMKWRLHEGQTSRGPRGSPFRRSRTRSGVESRVQVARSTPLTVARLAKQLAYWAPIPCRTPIAASRTPRGMSGRLGALPSPSQPVPRRRLLRFGCERGAGASWSKPDHCPVFDFNVRPLIGVEQLHQRLHVGRTGCVGAVRPRNKRVHGVELPVTGNQPGHRPGAVVTEDGALTNIDAPLERLLLVVAANLHRDLHRPVGQQRRLRRQHHCRRCYRLSGPDANGCQEQTRQYCRDKPHGRLLRMPGSRDAPLWSLSASDGVRIGPCKVC